MWELASFLSGNNVTLLIPLTMFYSSLFVYNVSSRSSCHISSLSIYDVSYHQQSFSIPFIISNSYLHRGCLRRKSYLVSSMIKSSIRHVLTAFLLAWLPYCACIQRCVYSLGRSVWLSGSPAQGVGAFVNAKPRDAAKYRTRAPGYVDALTIYTIHLLDT